MSIVRVAGFALFAAAAGSGLYAGLLDQALQRYRRPDLGSANYWITPWRLQEDLYVSEGKPLVARAWRAIILMFVLGFVGALLVGVAAV